MKRLMPGASARLTGLLVVGWLSVGRPALADPLAITDAWARATPPGATTAAAYFAITNSGTRDDRLVAVRSDAASKVELHTTVKASGLMKMVALESLPVPAGATAKLEPGGDHLMFMGLNKPFEPGRTIEVTLVFAQAGERTFAMPVRDARRRRE